MFQSLVKGFAPTTRLVWWMALGLGVAVLPLFVHQATWPLVILGWCFVAGVSLLEMRILSCRKPELQFTMPYSAGVGNPFSLDISLRCSLKALIACEVHAETRKPLRLVKNTFGDVRSGNNKLSLEFIGEARGKGALQAVWIRLKGPFGLFYRVFRIDCGNSEIAIVPSIERVKEIILKHFGSRALHGGVRLERFTGQGSSFDTLEPYLPGHNYRDVDWKASARHQALHVRRYRIERNQRLILCLDTGHLMADKLEGSQRLDHAIHASLLLSYFALRAGDLVGVCAYDAKPQMWLKPLSGVRNFHRLHHACASLQAKPVETNHVLGLHYLLSHLKRRTMVIVFSEFNDATTAELMVETLGKLVKKHLIVFVTLDEPLYEEAFQKNPESPEQVAEAVVMSQFRHERSKVLMQLRSLGVLVVHGLPELATIQLIRRYTEIKSKELIG